MNTYTFISTTPTITMPQVLSKYQESGVWGIAVGTGGLGLLMIVSLISYIIWNR